MSGYTPLSLTDLPGRATQRRTKEDLPTRRTNCLTARDFHGPRAAVNAPRITEETLYVTDFIGVRCRIEMLGGLRILWNDRQTARISAPKVGALLARLACFPDRAHSREELME